jgi:hypothetical protein
VPGFFNACSTEAYSLECLENVVGCVVTVKAEALAQKRAANSGSLIMVTHRKFCGAKQVKRRLSPVKKVISFYVSKFRRTFVVETSPLVLVLLQLVWSVVK